MRHERESRIPNAIFIERVFAEYGNKSLILFYDHSPQYNSQESKKTDSKVESIPSSSDDVVTPNNTVDPERLCNKCYGNMTSWPRECVSGGDGNARPSNRIWRLIKRSFKITTSFSPRGFDEAACSERQAGEKQLSIQCSG